MADKQSDTKTMIVSGAASGIGKHMALALTARGHNVVMLDRNVDALSAVLAEAGLTDSPRVMPRMLDVRDAAGWEQVVLDCVARFGSLDVMWNIAGYLMPGYVHEIDAQVLEQHVDVNVKGVMFASRVAARQMVKQGSGHIVNIASIAGISHVPGLAAYCASKHAVRGFSLALAHELSAHGVHVSVVCPDAVETPMLQMQTKYAEAAMTFGGGRGLTLQEVERALFSVLAKRPLEVVLPIPGSGRGALSRLSNAFPSLARFGLKSVQRQGRKAQSARMRDERASKP